MQLKEMNKDGNCYKIKKNGRTVQRRDYIRSPSCTDKINDVNLPPLNLLVIIFQSVLAKITELTNLINE